MTNINLPSLETADFSQKTVIVRCDFDIPLSKELEIEDDTRLVSGISTIEHILEKGGKVVAIGHLGRPTNNKLSLESVARWFALELASEAKEIVLGEFKGWQIKDNFVVLENLRFFEGEEENDPQFAKKLADLGDIYVNEAFGSSHRNHASIVGIPSFLPHFAGFHLLKEVKILSSLLVEPNRPLTVIVGGAKIETKLPLIAKMHRFADYVLVGGELADEDKLLIKEQHEEIVDQKAMLLIADLTQDKKDITPISLENFEQIIGRSNTIIWNGPMGELVASSSSTLTLATAILSSGARKIVGGGDTIGFLNKNDLLQKFDFVSVGGGAMLSFLSGENLPGIEALLS